MEVEYVYGAPVVDQNPVHVIVGHHGFDDQCITFTERDQVHPTSKLFGRPLVGRARSQNRPFPGLFEVAVLGSLRFPSEMWLVDDSPYYTRRFCLTSILVGLGAPIADVFSKVPLTD